jgi:hypothetical protein
MYPQAATRTGEEGNPKMPSHAIARIEDEDLKLSDPASPEEMVQRRRVAERLRAKMAKLATEHDKRLWQKFLALGRERLTFRS